MMFYHIAIFAVSAGTIFATPVFPFAGAPIFAEMSFWADECQTGDISGDSVLVQAGDGFVCSQVPGGTAAMSVDGDGCITTWYKGYNCESDTENIVAKDHGCTSGWNSVSAQC